MSITVTGVVLSIRDLPSFDASRNPIKVYAAALRLPAPYPRRWIVHGLSQVQTAAGGEFATGNTVTLTLTGTASPSAPRSAAKQSPIAT